MLILKGRIIDGNGAEPIENGALVVEDNMIKTVCREHELPHIPGAQIISIDDGSILPGLIESHVHLSFGSASAFDWVTSTPQLQMAYALNDMAALRNQGYTSFRDMGSDVILLKPAVERGLLDLPRIYGAGKILSQIGGHGDFYQKLSIDASLHTYSPAFLVTGVAEVRRACRINVRNGADFIKIMTSGGVFSQGDGAHPHSHFSDDEIRAAVEEAENMGSYVASHAQTNRGIKTALKNGVKSIEHGFYLDDECVEYMVKNNCFYVPTLSIMHVSKCFFETVSYGLDYLREKTAISYEAHYKAVELARKAGVKIGLGCDFLSDRKFGCSYDKANMEFERLFAAGLTPMEIITAATKTGSEIIMKQDQLGTLEEGKLADLIVIKGNPAEDIRVMCNADNVKLVVQDGRIVKDILGTSAEH